MKKRRSSQEQFTVMIDFMERYGDLTRPQQGPHGRLWSWSDKLWQQLTGLLNSSGVNKTAEKWKKVWVDWKTKTKKKAMRIRRHAGGTGGGPSSRQTLTALEERVLAIMGLSAVVGQRELRDVVDVRPSPQPSQMNPIAGGTTSSQIGLIQDSEHQVALKVAVEVCSDAEYLSGTSEPICEGQLPPPPPLPPLRTPIPPRTLPRTHTSIPPEFLSPRCHELMRRRHIQTLQLEEKRHQRLHEREVERERLLHEREVEHLRLESQKIEVERTRNEILRRLAEISQNLTQLIPPTH